MKTYVGKTETDINSKMIWIQINNMSIPDYNNVINNVNDSILNFQSQIDSIIVPDYFSDIFVLQGEIDTIKVRINDIDRIRLHYRVTNIKSQVAINTQVILDVQSAYSISISGYC
jgi:hypothetical protein